MMKNPRPEEENKIKDIKNLFRPKQELNYNPIKNTKNLFRPEKENKVIKDLEILEIYLEILRISLRMKKKIIIKR